MWTIQKRAFQGLLLTLSLTIWAGDLGVPDREDIEYPDDEPATAEQIELGKTLFFDNRLSDNGTMSCATCHNPDLGFGDGLALGLGSTGNKLERHTPHLYNLAWNVSFFWDGRAGSLEQQALMPIVAQAEMNMPINDLMARLKGVEAYVSAFDQAYPNSGLTENNLGHALASFQRTIVVDDTPFDRYMQGKKTAMSPSAIRGMALFQGKAKCTKCHSGPNFTDNSFHNIGVDNGDVGRGEIVPGTTMKGAFKTPGLRNILLTAPYMHDGSVATLEEVVIHYIDAPKSGKSISPTLEKIDLTQQEIFDLVAFMGALTQPLVIERPKIP